MSAIRKAEDQIMRGHLETCVRDAFAEGSEDEKHRKINEVMGALDSFRRFG